MASPFQAPHSGADLPVLGILASGRGSNARAILEAAASGTLPARVGLVLSDNRDAPVLRMAGEFGVEGRFIDPGRPRARLTPEQETAYVEALRERGVAWICLAGFMRILGKPLLEAFPQRILNIHPSLLPAFPGLHAQQQALDHGVKTAGCTVHFVDEECDHGPIVLQASVTIFEGDTEESLSARILEQEHRIYPLAVQWLCEDRLEVVGGRVRVRGEQADGPGSMLVPQGVD
mgnify:CR=1 FL=1